jgi:HD-GYP domain-containing protein (c-di-GMP phosphodiesterase class II)
MKHLQLPEEITDAALYHHENYDGSGFPYGLKGEQIPESARIVAVANLIVNRRSKNEPVWKIVSYLESMDGIHFDPLVVNAAIEVLYSV